jgi:hypothetical protein
MKFMHHDFKIELPDEWWIAAGMLNFVPSSSAYRCDHVAARQRRVCLIQIADIEPVRRTPGVPLFNDCREERIPASERVQRILRGFVQNAEMPPVEALRQTKPGPYPFRLTQGVHRLYCSLAAGYTEIPAVKGFDLKAFNASRNLEELC